MMFSQMSRKNCCKMYSCVKGEKNTNFLITKLLKIHKINYKSGNKILEITFIL
jgi:hypothetical protein